MTDSRRVSAPATNQEGVQQAIRQLSFLSSPGWRIRYDWRADLAQLRGPSLSRLAISYYLPSRPQILFRLDAHTSELTGIDFTDCRSALARTDRATVSIFGQFVFNSVLRAVGLRQWARTRSRALEGRVVSRIDVGLRDI